ncbi:TGB3 [Babaco mosaic virus]|uniref:TGB3 n=1 Tax=Babaco mosaic virus TaxID=2060511 RepID=A0A2H4ZU30_9VIRU|nr:TGB3 [Babaco mosaic virus]AUG45971.1 TGB3 [Babaco mosaic virus]
MASLGEIKIALAVFVLALAIFTLLNSNKRETCLVEVSATLSRVSGQDCRHITPEIIQALGEALVGLRL